MASQELAQEQGVSTPLITVKTKTEKIRIIRVQPGVYRMVKSFVASSLKEEYEWRVGYEYPEFFVWRKPNKWELRVFKSFKAVESEPLPVRGIYRVKADIIPFAVLSSNNDEVLFVALSNEIGMLYENKIPLVFTREAPIAITPMIPLPFSRPILVYEILDVLQHYVAI